MKDEAEGKEEGIAVRKSAPLTYILQLNPFLTLTSYVMADPVVEHAR